MASIEKINYFSFSSYYGISNLVILKQTQAEREKKINVIFYTTYWMHDFFSEMIMEKKEFLVMSLNRKLNIHKKQL